MKIRTGFVSNSSSSSYVVILPNRFSVEDIPFPLLMEYANEFTFERLYDERKNTATKISKVTRKEVCCKLPIGDDIKFCPKCGKSVENSYIEYQIDISDDELIAEAKKEIDYVIQRGGCSEDSDRASVYGISRLFRNRVISEFDVSSDSGYVDIVYADDVNSVLNTPLYTEPKPRIVKKAAVKMKK